LGLALGSDGRAGAGTAEDRVAGRFVAVEVALVAVLVRDRCWTGAAGVSEDWRGVAAASDGAVDVAGVRADTEGSVELASGTLLCSVVVCSVVVAALLLVGRETSALSALRRLFHRPDFVVLTGKSSSGWENQGRGAMKGPFGAATGAGEGSRGGSAGAGGAGGAGSVSCGTGGVGVGIICDEWVEVGV
jgi:hypothetical protein